MKVDLHCHSHFSDGVLSPTELLGLASENKVELLALTDHDTLDGLREARLAAERAFLATLDGSCQTPIAALARIDQDRLTLTGEILKPDGSAMERGVREGAVADGAAMGQDLAAALLTAAGPDFLEI